MKLEQTLDQQQYDELDPIVRSAYVPGDEGEFRLSLAPRGESASAAVAAARQREAVARAVHKQFLIPVLREQGLMVDEISAAIKRVQTIVGQDGAIEHRPLSADGVGFMVSTRAGQTFGTLKDLADELTASQQPAKTEKPATEKRVVREAAWSGVPIRRYEDDTVEVAGKSLDSLDLKPVAKLAIATKLGFTKSGGQAGATRSMNEDDAQQLAAIRDPTARLREARRRGVA